MLGPCSGGRSPGAESCRCPRRHRPSARSAATRGQERSPSACPSAAPGSVLATSAPISRRLGSAASRASLRTRLIRARCSIAAARSLRSTSGRNLVVILLSVMPCLLAIPAAFWLWHVLFKSDLPEESNEQATVTADRQYGKLV